MISGGGRREKMDRVGLLSNDSRGKMGYGIGG
ncbi:phosphopantothenoylcysteine decarboxylase, partial [Cytobacillus oceanisediminis]